MQIMPQYLNRTRLMVGMVVSMLACAGPSFAEELARVLSVEGVSVVQRGGVQPRILGAADALMKDDLISVGPASHAIIEYPNHTRITLRPDTLFRMEALTSPQPETLINGLMKGGLRSDAFDARWCEADCLKEERRKPATQKKPVARVVEMKGTVASAPAGVNARLLVPGTAIYEREGIATGANSYAVLVFSDGSRISLAENSHLAILAYRFNDKRRTGSAEIHHLSGGARVQSGAIAKHGPEYYRFVTPMGVLRPHGTGWDSFAGAVKQTADQGADTVRETGEAVVGAVQDTAGQAAQAALNTAITPILQTMSALMTGLRDNPPTTEAGWDDLMSQMTRASDRLHGALDEAKRVGGSAVDSREFKTVVGLALAAELEFFAVGAYSTATAGSGATFGAEQGAAQLATLRALVAGAKASPYQSESLALVGLSSPDLERVSISNQYSAHTIIETEVGGYLASQGNAAANDFFSKAEAAANDLRQRAQQAEQAAAQAAAEAEQRAIEDAQRLAEEARAAAREADQRTMGEVKRGTGAAAAEVGATVADWAGERAREAKAGAGKAGAAAAEVGTTVVDWAGEREREAKAGAGKAGAAAAEVGTTVADWAGERAREAKAGAGKAGAAAAEVGTTVADWAGERAREAKAGTDAAAAQSEKALRAVEEIAQGVLGNGGRLEALNDIASIGSTVASLQGTDVDVRDEVAGLLGDLYQRLGQAFTKFAADRSPDSTPDRQGAETEARTSTSTTTLDDGTVVTITESDGPNGSSTIREERRPDGTVERKTNSDNGHGETVNMTETRYPSGMTELSVQRTSSLNTYYSRNFTSYPDGSYEEVVREASPDQVRYFNKNVYSKADGSVVVQPQTEIVMDAAGVHVHSFSDQVARSDGSSGTNTKIDLEIANGHATMSVVGAQSVSADGARRESLVFGAEAGPNGVRITYEGTPAIVEGNGGAATASQEQGSPASQLHAESALTDSKLPAELHVWDGSVEVAGRIIRKGELLRAMPSGQLVFVAGNGALVTNAPRPDLVKVAPGLFEDSIGAVNGRQSREAEGSSDTGSRKGKSGNSSGGEGEETLKHERKDPKNSSSSVDSEPDPKGGGDSQGGERKDPRQTASNTEDEPDPRGGSESSYGGGVKDSRPPSNDGEEEPDPLAEREARRREPTERALYVWARDGVIRLNRGGNAVEVAAGNAVVVTKDQVMLLDYVPSFLRFDRTPQPSKLIGRFELPAFVMPDGSIAGNCVAR